MLKYRDECCGCAVPAYPCIGDVCSNKRVPRYYCDICGVGGDIYEVEGEDTDLCEQHLEEYLQKAFDELIFQEKADLLKINIKRREN